MNKQDDLAHSLARAAVQLWPATERAGFAGAVRYLDGIPLGSRAHFKRHPSLPWLQQHYSSQARLPWTGICIFC